jgi:hypothetical protein
VTMSVTIARAGFAALVAASLASCTMFRREPAPGSAAEPQPMRAIPVYEIVPTEGESGVSVAPSRSRDPFAGMDGTKRVTLSANNANARTLLLSLAREAGISLIVSPDVSARVSVNFNDVPAAEAMRAIISEAGLSVLTAGLQSPWPPVVFYQLPVNINLVSAETIAARFGVSAEMARFIVESRPRP